MKSNVRNYFFVVLLWIILVITCFDTFAQCAMCRATVESNEGKVGEGLNLGILYLMAVPYILLLGGGIWFFKNKAKKVGEKN